MSAMRYTFFSESLEEELTAVLTLPDKRPEPQRLLNAVLIFPSKGREADHLLRTTSLEGFSRPPYSVVTVSLPARVLTASKEKLEKFADDELEAIAKLFRLSWQAAYACDPSDVERLRNLQNWRHKVGGGEQPLETLLS